MQCPLCSAKERGLRAALALPHNVEVVPGGAEPGGGGWHLGVLGAGSREDWWLPSRAPGVPRRARPLPPSVLTGPPLTWTTDPWSAAAGRNPPGNVHASGPSAGHLAPQKGRCRRDSQGPELRRGCWALLVRPCNHRLLGKKAGGAKSACGSMSPTRPATTVLGRDSLSQDTWAGSSAGREGEEGALPQPTPGLSVQ